MPYQNTACATLDFETRSPCSIKAAGSWRYSLDPRTEVLCMAFRLPHWVKGRTELWHPAFPALDIPEDCSDWGALAELFAWIASGKPIEAHNAFFERGIWVNILVPMGWPAIRPHQWRCSAAKAAAHSLPRGLEDAIAAMRIPGIQKDTEGGALMKKMVKPRKPKKADLTAWGRLHNPCWCCWSEGRIPSWKKDGAETAKGVKCPICGGVGWRAHRPLPPMPLLYQESREEMERLWAYNRMDVLAEEALSEQLPDLNAEETEMYLLDQVVNERGFHLDREAVDAALALIDVASVDINAELAVLTEGEVERVTQREQMKDWLATQGLQLQDTRKETLDELLDREDDIENAPWMQPPPPKARRALELMRMGGRSSTAKYVAMREWLCPDSRVHGGLLYHGANTGRWSGKGVQPHNFPKGSAISQEDLWTLLKTLDPARIVSDAPRDKKGAPFYASLMEALSQGLRGAITAAPGKVLYVADFAAIEARVLLWLAEDDDALDVFRTGQDIYCYMADDIYGYPTNKVEHPKERSIGKIAVLGLGYQMGASKFVDTCKLGGVDIPEDTECAECGRVSREHRKVRDHDFAPVDDAITAVRIVDAYRSKFWRVRDMWRDQEETALLAVENEGECYQAGRVTWHVEDGFLYCTLPSGRRLAYPDPEIRQTLTTWGEVRNQVTFMGVNPMNHQWQRQNTYGGKLVENVTQAVARDILAMALMRCEQSGIYTPVLTVHDEVVSEALEGTGNLKEYEALVAQPPSWALDCPIAAEGFCAHRYKK